MRWAIALITIAIIGGRLVASPQTDYQPADSSEKADYVGILRPEPATERQIELWRLGVFSATTLSLCGYAYSRMDDWWGHNYGPAHIKHNDWAGDGLVQTDETSHLVITYKITQAGIHFARWTGFSDPVSRCIGAGIAGAIMTWVEYPVDTHNPIQGFGYTDMAANIVGISFAVTRDIWPEYLDYVDFRISVKNADNVNNEIIAQSFAENDAFIYWITVSPVRRFPVHVAAGYSANHDSGIAEREVYIGFGTSIAEIAGMVDPRWRRKLDLWNFYEISVTFRVD